MPVTCAVCGKKFTSIGEVADHISETNKGIQGDEFAGLKEQTEEMMMMPDSKEREQLLDAISDAGRGFAHVRYYDKTGLLLPESEVITLYVTTTAGPKFCMDCRANFANLFRVYEHFISTGHGGSFRDTALDRMRKFEEFQRRHF